MNYENIVNSSFRIAWQNKSLWILGLFAGGGANVAMNWQSDFDGFGADINVDPEAVFQANPWLIPAIVGSVLLFIISNVILNAICTPAIIDAVNQITRGGYYKFGDSVSAGLKFVWRILGLLILQFFAFVFGIGLLAVVGILIGFGLAAIHGALIIPLILFGIAVFFVSVFVIGTIFSLSYRAVVARDTGISDALHEGWVLLRGNLKQCLVIFLIYVGLSIAIAIFGFMLAMIVGLPLMLAMKAAGINFVLGTLLLTPIFWLFLLPVSGFLGAVFETLYTLFYFRLYEPDAAEATAADYPTGPSPA